MENSNNKQLTTWEAACIITGYGIGGGVMAMPYLANKCGIILSFIILLLAFLASYILHLMIAELSIKTGKNAQLVEIFTKYGLPDKFKKVGTIILFVIIAIVLYTNLAAYIAEAQEILIDLIKLPSWLLKIIFYVLAATVALFGLKILGISEKYAVTVIFLVIGTLVVASIFNITNTINFSFGNISDSLAFFGMGMFAFSAFFSVPQAVKGLDGDVNKIKKSVFIGMLNNFILMTLVIIFSLLSSTEITKVCISGWSQGIGLWAEILGSCFTLLAMLTTYWSISLALADIFEAQLKLNSKLCWVIATIPSLLISFIPNTGFMDFIQLAAGAIAILIALFVIPAYHKCKKDAGPNILNKFSTIPVEILIFIAYILMAVGNLI